jgi:hypothetical protein
MPDDYYYVPFVFMGKLEYQRPDELVFVSNMLRSPKGELIHLNGVATDDSFSNLQEQVH